MADQTGLAAPARVLRRRPLFIDVQHGLCNRLRAMASASTIAESTDRELIVIWRPDSHCEARLSDLLLYPGAVIETESAAEACRAQAGLVYNYMEVEPDSCFEAPILENAAAYQDQDVYIRSAYSLAGPHYSLSGEQRFLRSLIPTEPVRELIAQVRHPNQVAAHIRTASGEGFEHLPYETQDGNWPEHRHQELIAWRRKSSAERFIARFDQLVAIGQAETIFVASDLPETYALLKERYGSRMTALNRDVYDRSAVQLQYALADLILLSAAQRLLASTWSSFSDLAQYLARPGRPVERSGVDF